MYGKLSIQQAPPLSVPARFFLTAPLFGILACLILLFNGGDLLVSRWTPGMLAVTHCMTLGFFASVMIGAVQQLLPVLVGSTISRPRLFAVIIHTLWLPGIVLLVAGFFNFKTVLILPALILIGAAVSVFVAVVLYSLYRGISANESAPGIKLAVVSLFVTLVMGVLLALGYTGMVPLWRPVLTNLHLTWGLVGWIGLLIMVVAWQVVPMFQITRSYPLLLRRLTIPAVLVLLILKSGLAWQSGGNILITANHAVDLLLAAGFLCFALSTLYLQHVSRRKIRDSHKDFWRLAMVNLVLVQCLWITAMITANPLFELLAGVVFLLGFAMAVVTGMLLKIIAFLIWLHLQAATEGITTTDGRRKYSVPKMKKIIPESRSNLLLFTLATAQLVIIAAVCYPAVMSIPAAVIWLIFFSILAAVMTRAVLRYYQIVKKLGFE